MKLLTRCLPLVFALFFISLPAAAQEALCEYACTESTPCDLECTTVETWQRMTCGEFGICGAPPPPPPSCNYVPVTNPFFCHIDIDNHFFTYSIEAEYESFYVDTNGHCPSKYIQVVGAEAWCWSGTDPVDCCAGDFGLPWNFCFAMIYGDSCHRN